MERGLPNRDGAAIQKIDMLIDETLRLSGNSETKTFQLGEADTKNVRQQTSRVLEDEKHKLTV